MTTPVFGSFAMPADQSASAVCLLDVAQFGKIRESACRTTHRGGICRRLHGAAAYESGSQTDAIFTLNACFPLAACARTGMQSGRPLLTIRVEIGATGQEPSAAIRGAEMRDPERTRYDRKIHERTST